MTAGSQSRGSEQVTGDPAALRPWVSVRDLGKTFGSVKVLSGVDFSAYSGEIHALVGQNGSGKSTLIKVLSGVHPADDGSVVELDGTPVSIPVSPLELRRHGLAFVHQDLGLVDECSVLENIRLGQFTVRPLSRRIVWSQEAEAAKQTLARLHTEIDPSRLVSTLHPGEKAVVAIGRALQSIVPGTGCVVFDESTRALPREILPDFYDTIRRLAATGTAVIIVSHRLDEVLALADRVTVLQDGNVIAGGRSTEGMTESALAHLLLGREIELLEDRKTQVVRRPDDAPALRARGICASALRKVDLDVHRGEVVGVTGPTGSGHAELAAALAGVLAGATGTVTVDATDFILPVRDPGRIIDAGLALVPEERATEGLALALTAQENLTLPRVHARGRVRLTSGWQNQEFEEAAEMLGIVPARPHQLCSAFSGGNQQKILLAKWLLNRPKVVLLHEPTQAVDVGARMDILRAIRAAAATGVGVLIASIEPQDLAVICDRVVILRDGEIVDELSGTLTPEAIAAATYPLPVPAG